MDEPILREERLRQILRELERALSQAIADSSEIGDSLRRIQEEGFELQMIFECRSVGPADPTPAEPPRRRRAMQPVFRIHGDDLAFLRSIGIDPTRRRGAR